MAKIHLAETYSAEPHSCLGRPLAAHEAAILVPQSASTDVLVAVHLPVFALEVSWLTVVACLGTEQLWRSLLSWPQRLAHHQDQLQRNVPQFLLLMAV